MAKEICKQVPESHKDCPVFVTLSLIANKWSIRLLHSLLSADKGTLRFSQLKKEMTGISQRELTKHLREFEACGIVLRKVYPQVPPKVEYTITKLGQSLCEPISALSAWAEKYGPQVQKNKAKAPPQGGVQLK